METTVDYSAVLEDLKARRDKLNAAIEAIEQMQGQVVLGALASLGTSGGSANQLRSDSFFGMGVGDAAVKYLGLVKAPKKIDQILTALEEGGLTHTSKNFYSTVFTALQRREQSEGDITRVKRGEWGLAAWYPGLRKGKKNGEKSEPEAEPKKT
jgi:hypothetical protein